jgi:ring-1,2-phenylacetyl-CoA epoxidase subunit PaaB
MSTLTSLDPRITRLGIYEVNPDTLVPKAAMDQFQTYEAFFQRRDNAKYEHAGPVHAPTLELAFLFAKEQYSRRQTCSGLFVISTQDIMATATGSNEVNIYAELNPSGLLDSSSEVQDYEIFYLKRRGMQHVHAGRVEAVSAEAALFEAKAMLGEEASVVNVWVAPTASIRFSSPEEKDFWNTLPLKKYREAVVYKVQDRIEKFKKEQLTQ